jgi:hypothetical protein
MNKNQAIAKIDALMVPVAAERQRRLQKRQKFMLRLYPVLKRAPPEERAELLKEARGYAFCQWAVYVTFGFLVAVFTYGLRDQIFGATTDVPTSTMLVLFPLCLTPAAVLYAHIRGYLRLLVGAKYEHAHEATSQRAA